MTFNVTFTPFSSVFGGTSEKYIPLSALEGMEIWVQLESCGNAIKYQWIPYVKSFVAQVLSDVHANGGGQSDVYAYNTTHHT